MLSIEAANPRPCRVVGEVSNVDGNGQTKLLAAGLWRLVLALIQPPQIGWHALDLLGFIDGLLLLRHGGAWTGIEYEFNASLASE